MSGVSSWPAWRVEEYFLWSTVGRSPMLCLLTTHFSSNIPELKHRWSLSLSFPAYYLNIQRLQVSKSILFKLTLASKQHFTHGMGLVLFPILNLEQYLTLFRKVSGTCIYCDKLSRCFQIPTSTTLFYRTLHAACKSFSYDLDITTLKYFPPSVFILAMSPVELDAYQV